MNATTIEITMSVTTIEITVPGTDYVGSQWSKVDGGWLPPAFDGCGFDFGEAEVEEEPVSLESIAAEAVRLSARENWAPVVINGITVAGLDRVGMHNRAAVVDHLLKLAASQAV